MTRGASESRPYSYPLAEEFEIHSEGLDRDWGIQVGLPLTYNESRDTYPVLYVMDGHFFFNLALEIQRCLYDEVREVIIVAVGPAAVNGVSPAVSTLLNPREFPRPYLYSPSPRWDLTDAFGSRLKAQAETQGNLDLVFGGAPKLLEFLTSELHPVIAGRYRVRGDDLGLFGTSAAGNFALYCLLSGKSPFRKYVAGSPATAYNDGYIYEMERAYAAANTDLDARVFIGAGSEEATNESTKVGGIVSGVARFTELFAMRKYPSLVCRTHVFPGEGHSSVIPSLFVHGLQHLWPSGNVFLDSYRPRSNGPNDTAEAPAK